MSDVHAHHCEAGARDLTGRECRERGYCECECGFVAPHPRHKRPQDREWVTKTEMVAELNASPEDRHV